MRVSASSAMHAAGDQRHPPRARPVRRQCGVSVPASTPRNSSTNSPSRADARRPRNGATYSYSNGEEVAPQAERHLEGGDQEEQVADYAARGHLQEQADHGQQHGRQSRKEVALRAGAVRRGAVEPVAGRRRQVAGAGRAEGRHLADRAIADTFVRADVGARIQKADDRREHARRRPGPARPTPWLTFRARANNRTARRARSARRGTCRSRCSRASAAPRTRRWRGRTASARSRTSGAGRGTPAATTSPTAAPCA